MQRLNRGAVYWLIPVVCLACFLIEPRITTPDMALPTTGWAYSNINLEDLPQVSVMEVVPHLRFPLPK